MNPSLEQWLERILALHPTEIDMGLARIRAVANRLGINPRVPVITVAGTNGKGSTVALLNALATAAGARVGVYTSPHILRFNERVRIAGSLVDDTSLCHAFAAVDAARGDTSLTFFEFTTLAAFWLFQQAELDLWVLEVGLGGRLDAVNLVDPSVALVTSISLDHTDWLGSDLAQIAAEKAGIARPDKPLLYGMKPVPVTVKDWAQNIGAVLAVASAEFGADRKGLWWQQGGETSQLPLTNKIPLGEDNLAMAVQALAHVGFLPETNQIIPVAEAVTLPGRSQYFYHQERHWYVDVGHNPAAIERFFARLPESTGRLVGVCAMLADKSTDTLSAQAHKVSHWYLADLSVPRGGTAKRLSDSLPEGVAHSCHGSVHEALKFAYEHTRPGDTVVVLGSFYTVAEAETYLEGQVP